MDAYEKFITKKSQLNSGEGFKPTFLPDSLFDFQKYLTQWAVEQGRSAMFADCGMGKTIMQLVWAQNVIEQTNKPVLILSPLSVSQQTVEEAEKFDIEATRSMDGKFKGKQIVVTNYERLQYFDTSKFAGVVCDESSILKNFDGTRKGEITEFMKKTKYRLLCTATASPNDYIELGTSSEALGHLGYMDMLGTFFKNDENSLHPAFIGSKWRFKHHAEEDFWRWVCSWARSCRRPSDLGFDDSNFQLTDLIENEICVKSPNKLGTFFPEPARTLNEQRDDNRATLEARCEKAAELLDTGRQGIAWCHLNKEADLLEKTIPGAKQVKGSDKDSVKEQVFDDFRKGKIRVLVTKPKIAAFGMNWQHCDHMTYFPTHSFEQYYQAVRRCHRFGQKNNVTVDLITSEAQRGVLNNLQDKAVACEKMFDSLVAHMQNILKVKRMIKFNKTEVMPRWL